MNKRQKKKQAGKPIVSKDLIKLVKQYTGKHSDIDLCGMSGVSFVEIGEDSSLIFKPKMSRKSYLKMVELCSRLFVETQNLMYPEAGITCEDWGDEEQYDYRIVKCQPKGEYQPYRDKNFNNLNSGYYVNQREISEDNYEGEVYHPLGRGRYLFYRYRC